MPVCSMTFVFGKAAFDDPVADHYARDDRDQHDQQDRASDPHFAVFVDELLFRVVQKAHDDERGDRDEDRIDKEQIERSDEVFELQGG